MFFLSCLCKEISSYRAAPLWRSCPCWNTIPHLPFRRSIFSIIAILKPSQTTIRTVVYRSSGYFLRASQTDAFKTLSGTDYDNIKLFEFIKTAREVYQILIIFNPSETHLTIHKVILLILQ